MKTIKCPNCESSIPADAQVCPNCGEVLTTDVPAAQPEPLSSPKKDRKGFALASILLAASFLVFWGLTYIAYSLSDDVGSVFIVLAFFSPLLSIPGIIFGIKGLRSSRKGLAVVGLVLNGLLFLVLLFIGVFMYLISQNWR